MKKYDLYSRRDPAKNFSPLPNEVFYLDLSYGAIAVYGYLMHIEDRKTFQSYASYNTIGRAVKMSANTVRKYVLELEDKCLIRTEPTTVVTRDGRKRNGTLRYHIRPILGHTRAAFTLDTYTHTTGDMQKRASEVIGDFLTDIFGEELRPWEESAKVAGAQSV